MASVAWIYCFMIILGGTCLVNIHQLDTCSSCKLTAETVDSSFPSASDDVIFVHVHCRHGARSPTATYPTDPYANMTIYWPQGWAQLSKFGVMQHYELGQFLRKRYHNLLSEDYNRKDIQVFSSNLDRTIMSAQANLAGLFPPTPNQKWNKNIPWQPIPVQTLPQYSDFLLRNEDNCPKLLMLNEEVKKLKATCLFQEKNRDVFALMSEGSGLQINSIATAAQFYNVFLSQWTHNLTLPRWAEQIFFTSLHEIQTVQLAMHAYNHDIQRLRSGPLLGRMVSHMKMKVNGTLMRKMMMYVSHDSDMVAFMRTLGYSTPLIPNYADTILVELHKSAEGNHSVQVIYRNNTDGSLLPVSVHGCAMPCPLERFINLTASQIPDNWFEECKVPDGTLIAKENLLMAKDEDIM